jgi:hypothetical protein
LLHDFIPSQILADFFRSREDIYHGGVKMVRQKEPGETGGAGCREDGAGELCKLA